MPTNLSLTKFCVMDKDARKAKFAFRLEDFSILSKHEMTKSFNFGGNFWKFQVSRTKEHLGLYLRWYGTARPLSKQTITCSCTASTRFSVINHFFPDNSISEGPSKTADTFEKIGYGVGYSKVVALDELEKSPGFLLNDNLYLQLSLNIIQTTFYNNIAGAMRAGRNYVESEKFPFYGSTWSIIIYPEGEELDESYIDQDQTRNTSFDNPTTDQSREYSRDMGHIQGRRTPVQRPKTAGIYLRREPCPARNSLRHNVQFVITVDGAGACGLDQHFYSHHNNVFGSATFMPAKELEKRLRSGNLVVEVKYLTIVPYLYYSYGVNHKENTLGEGFLFNDHYKYPWKFKLIKNPSAHKQNLQGVMKLDPARGSKRVKLIAKQKNILQVCWFVEILSPADILKSLTFASVGKRPVVDSFYSNSGERDAVNFQETTRQVSRSI